MTTRRDRKAAPDPQAKMGCRGRRDEPELRVESCGNRRYSNILGTLRNVVTFGQAVAAWAKRDLGLLEQAPNSSDRIDEMLARFGHPPGTNWCGAATGTWIQETAEQLHMPYPVRGTALAKGYREQFLAIGKWREPEALRADPSLLRVGDVAVFHRGIIGTKEGHVGIVLTEVDQNGDFECIEGNHDNGVFIVHHNLNEAKLYGAGSLDIELASVPSWMTQKPAAPAGLVPSKANHIPWLIAAAVASYYLTPRLTK